jgi:chorismate dehydratase
LALVSESVITAPLKSLCAFGQIDFINVLPITHVLERRRPPNMDLVMGTPGALNGMYRKGALDLGAMSSHYFLEDDGFELFPGISISARGPVGSVLFFSQKPLEKLAGARIGVTLASASSVQLLRILLAESYGVEAQFVPLENPEALLEQEHLDGFLVIGDRALLTDDSLARSGEIADYVRADLAEWWYQQFALPMVFGVWAARKSWVEANSQDFATLSTFLKSTYPLGLGPEFVAVLEQAAARTGLDKERLEHYYRHELDYTFSDEHARGLALYKSLCAKYRLL